MFLLKPFQLLRAVEVAHCVAHVGERIACDLQVGVLVGQGRRAVPEHRFERIAGRFEVPGEPQGPFDGRQSSPAGEGRHDLAHRSGRLGN